MPLWLNSPFRVSTLEESSSAGRRPTRLKLCVMPYVSFVKKKKKGKRKIKVSDKATACFCVNVNHFSLCSAWNTSSLKWRDKFTINQENCVHFASYNLTCKKKSIIILLLLLGYVCTCIICAWNLSENATCPFQKEGL